MSSTEFRVKENLSGQSNVAPVAGHKPGIMSAYATPTSENCSIHFGSTASSNQEQPIPTTQGSSLKSDVAKSK
ncbi:hypothetical protein D9613_012209 [Agrocybe pediades]|uniref:Uncharacterized protein n=1 Tax=Agrocybe pediades TaxID=84607 RepID=A0A8H4R1S7_9AGAR|nr:hypothetical protein D9613_012209 [Agrocybe pediades]